jgi:hypothetical protein
MDTKRVLERLDSLIEMGEQILRTPVSDEYYVDNGPAQRWRTSSLAFLQATLGADSTHYHEFEERCQYSHRHEAERGLAILQAAKDDIEGGYLQKFETLVSASVFTDFLEIAEHLLNNGYKDPAASLIGAVLEDGLRRICTNSGITLKSKEDISSLGQKLLQKQVYNPLQHKQVQVWNDVRNNADHGNFGEYKADDVKNMLEGVSGFLSTYLA